MLKENLPLVLTAGVSVLAAIVAAGARRPILFFYGAIFSTAILKTPQLPIVREKFALTELFMILLWLFWSQIPRVRRSLPSDRVVVPLGVTFILCCLASAMIGLATLQLRHGNMTRIYAGVFVEVANYAYGVMIVLAAIQVIDRWERLTGAVFAWLLGMAVASFVGTLGLVHMSPGWAYEEGTRRISSTLRNENQVPSMILPLILIPIMAAARRQLEFLPRVAMVCLTGGAFLAGIATGSRTAALMLVGAAISLGMILIRDSGSRSLFNLAQLRSLALLFMAAVVAYFVVAWSAYDGHYSLVRTPAWQRPAAMLLEAYQGERELDENRPRQMRAAMDQFFDTPFFGTGPKLGARTTDTHGEVHNTYFSLLLETGLVGLLLHLALLFQAGTHCLRATRLCPFQWYRMVGRATFRGPAVAHSVQQHDFGTPPTQYLVPDRLYVRVLELGAVGDSSADVSAASACFACLATVFCRRIGGVYASGPAAFLSRNLPQTPRTFRAPPALEGQITPPPSDHMHCS